MTAQLQVFNPSSSRTQNLQPLASQLQRSVKFKGRKACSRSPPYLHQFHEFITENAFKHRSGNAFKHRVPFLFK
jgi:hypothetical protein